jgi:hypothetical protein
MQKEGSEGGRRGLISHSHAWSWMAIPGKPSARLTHHLKLVTGQRFLRFSILKEIPAALQAFLVPLCPVKNVGHSQACAGEAKAMKNAELRSSIIGEDFAGSGDLDERRIS